VLERLRARLARMIAPKPAVSARMYAGARPSRLVAGWQRSNSSADTELAASLTNLRSMARALVRDFGYAKRARVIVVNNVVGSGIGLQAQVKTSRDELNKRVNDAIEEAFKRWTRADSCHTGGGLDFAELERASMGQVFEAGEIFIRMHGRAFGSSEIPFALEMIEPERLADELVGAVPGAIAAGAMVRMGVEVDTYYRPLAYWFRERHPGEFRLGAGATDRYERVPADQVLHLRIIDRWPQTRGEPWLHAAVRRLNDMDGLSEAEITAARGAASYMATIETPDEHTALVEKNQETGQSEIQIEPGLALRLQPGEKFNFVQPNRPNANLDPFLRMMLREVAAAAGVSYESLSRDYSQSNYSSSRLALLDDRDLWRCLQQWFIRRFRHEIHRRWLQQAVLARAIPEVRIEEYATDPSKFEAARFKPRGWSWIDPTKEVQAYKDAVRCGFTTVGDVIAQTGGGTDIEDVLEGRKQELDQMKELGLTFDTDPGADAKAPATPPPGKEPPDDDDENENENTSRPKKRLVSIGRA
jgi:lambda family phage portal protein